MSRTSAPVLTSLLLSLLLLLLLLLLLRDSAAAATEEKQPELKSCKTLDEVLLEKYVTRQKRFSSDDDASENATPLPSGSTDSSWLGLYLLLRDRAEQLCDKTLYTLLHERYSADTNPELATCNGQESATTTAVPEMKFEDQQANNVTLNSTAQKGSRWINASSAVAYNNDESSEKFLGTSSSEEDSTTSYYDSSPTILPGNVSWTFTTADNDASGNNSNETLERDNEDESDRNEAVHARSKEEFLASVYRDKEQPLGQHDDTIVQKKFLQFEDDAVDEGSGVGSTDHSTEIDNAIGDNSTIDEHDELVDEFFAKEYENTSSINVGDSDGANSLAAETEGNSNETASERDKFVDDFFANEDDDAYESDFVNRNTTDASSRESSMNDRVNDDDKFVDDFFANEDDDAYESDFVNKSTTDTSSRESSMNDRVNDDDKFVDDFFANEDDDGYTSDFVNRSTTETSSRESNMNDRVNDDNKFVDDFFANEHDDGQKSDFANSSTTETSSRESSVSDRVNDDNKFVGDFFALVDENTSGDGIRRIETNGHFKKQLDESENNNTASEGEPFVDDFFASENENLASNGIGSEEPRKDPRGALDDKANNNQTVSSEFNSTKSNDGISLSSGSSETELTPSMEVFFAAFSSEEENATNWEELANSTEYENSTIAREVSPTKRLGEEWSDVVVANFSATSSEMSSEIADYLNNSSANSSSKLENSSDIPDSSELISSNELLEAATAISAEKNATTAAVAQLRTYSNETAATAANGTEDRSTKYPDTGDQHKAGHTPASPSDDDLFKETTTATASGTPSSDDWSSATLSIHSHADEASDPALRRRRRRNVLMTFRDDEARSVASAAVASAGKLRAPEATSRLVNEEDDSSSSSSDDDDAWESSSDSSLNTRASSRNRPPRIITGEMNKANAAELQRQYRTFLLGLQSRQTQFAEKKEWPQSDISQSGTMKSEGSSPALSNYIIID